MSHNQRHFDDFTWGATRKVEGETKQGDHSNRMGSYEIGSVQFKTWRDWEIKRRSGNGNQTSSKSRSLEFSYPIPRDNLPLGSDGQFASPRSSQETVRCYTNRARPFEGVLHSKSASDQPSVQSEASMITPSRMQTPMYTAPRSSNDWNPYSNVPRVDVTPRDDLEKITSYLSDIDEVSPGNQQAVQRQVPLLNKPSVASFATNVSSEPSAQPYNKTSTINQFWKDLYQVQQDTIIQDESLYHSFGPQTPYNESLCSQTTPGSFLNKSMDAISPQFAEQGSKKSLTIAYFEPNGGSFINDQIGSQSQNVAALFLPSPRLREPGTIDLEQKAPYYEAKESQGEYETQSVISFSSTRSSVIGPRPAPFDLPVFEASETAPSKTSTMKDAFKKAFAKAWNASGPKGPRPMGGPN
jgi:Chitin synthase